MFFRGLNLKGTTTVALMRLGSETTLDAGHR
jgi:hypothetical protein